VCFCTLSRSSAHYIPASLNHIFPRYVKKWHYFRKELLNTKWVFISSTTFVWNISYSKKNWGRCNQLYAVLHVRYALFLSDFNLVAPCVLYIGRAHRYPPNTPFYIFFQQIYVLNFLNMLHTPFFLFKMPFIS
jgi:hypothetical protein